MFYVFELFLFPIPPISLWSRSKEYNIWRKERYFRKFRLVGEMIDGIRTRLSRSPLSEWMPHRSIPSLVRDILNIIYPTLTLFLLSLTCRVCVVIIVGWPDGICYPNDILIRFITNSSQVTRFFMFVWPQKFNLKWFSVSTISVSNAKKRFFCYLFRSHWWHSRCSVTRPSFEHSKKSEKTENNKAKSCSGQCGVFDLN